MSGLGRPIDLSYPSNRYAVAILLLSGAVGSIAAFVAGEGWLESLAWGVLAGGAAFLAWAIGREVDPDRASTAAIAAPLAAAAVAVGRPSLWSAAAVLLAARVAVRSTGVAPKPVDLAMVAVVVAAAASSAVGVPAGLLAGGILVADRALARPAPVFVAAAGLVVVLAAVAIGAVRGTLAPDPAGFELGEAVVAGLAGIGCLAVFGPARPRSLGDLTAEPLVGSRLRAARIVTAAALVGAAAWAGGPGVVALAPAGAALGALVVPRRGRGTAVI